MPTRRQTRRQALNTLVAGLTVSLAPLPAALRAKDFTVVKQGSFVGRSDHATSGSAAIIEQDGGFYISLGSDFAFDGAPDPKLGLGSDGYDAATQSGDLQANSGAQSYPLPEGVDPAAYNEIWLWCEEFNVPLGLAALN